MSDTAEIREFRNRLTKHLTRTGVEVENAERQVNRLQFEMASGHALVRVNGRYFNEARLDEISTAMGVHDDANEDGNDTPPPLPVYDAAAAGRAQAAKEIAARLASANAFT